MMHVIDQHIDELLSLLGQLARTTLNASQVEFLQKAQHNADFLAEQWSDLRSVLDDKHTHHTLGNALTPIIGHVYLLNKGMLGPLDERQQTLLYAISAVVDSLRQEISLLKRPAATD